MVKNTLLFECNSCGHRPLKWLGCCPECKEWNTIHQLSSLRSKSDTVNSGSLHTLDSIAYSDQERLITNIQEWDRVMGGGIVQGSLIIVTGDPGVGKSTLLLHVAHRMAQDNKIFYFSSEESLSQLKQRALRTGCTGTGLLFSDQAEVESIVQLCIKDKPTLIVVDSIQNCYSTDTQNNLGSIAQLKESAFSFMKLAKQHGISIILTGHITKEGIIAGPKLLEHMVDGVFYLQAEESLNVRMLRAVKNRFGSVNELGFFSMDGQGLQEVENINKELLTSINQAPGSILISTLEGSRPILLELQALCVPTKFGIPQRIITGIEHKQVTLIAAILEKYLQIPFSAHDIFFKVNGSFKLKESSVELGIALALLSTYFQRPLAEKSLALAEVSLTGAIKPALQSTIHIQEAMKFGISTIFTAHDQKKMPPQSITIHMLKNVYELLNFFN